MSDRWLNVQHQEIRDRNRQSRDAAAQQVEARAQRAKQARR